MRDYVKEMLNVAVAPEKQTRELIEAVERLENYASAFSQRVTPQVLAAVLASLDAIAPQAQDANEAAAPEMADSDFNSDKPLSEMTKAELEAECARLSVPDYGSKETLIGRITEALKAGEIKK